MKEKLLRRLRRSIRRTSPFLLARFVAALILLSPLWVVIICQSAMRFAHWKKLQTCRKFMARHKLAFLKVNHESLSIKVAGGGISNLSMIWECEDLSGWPAVYFAKVFLPLGTFWANVSPLVSPLPPVYGPQSRHRFVTDMVSRAQLAELQIPVPKLIMFDSVEKVMVTERLDGEMVSDTLQRMQERGRAVQEDLDIMKQCGEWIGKVHAAGFSFVDIQPSNCMWVPARKQVYFTDLEFCTREDRRAWDLGYFLCFLTALLSPALARQMKSRFLQGYAIHHQADWIEFKQMNLQLREYLPVFETIMDIRRYSPEELFSELFQA